MAYFRALLVLNFVFL